MANLYARAAQTCTRTFIRHIALDKMSSSDAEWFARFASLAPMDPRFTPKADLTCSEAIPAAPGWPPPGMPWMNKLDGVGPPIGTNPFLAAPLWPSTEPPRVASAVRGVPLPSNTSRKVKPIRPCRHSELDKLKGRMDALEDLLRSLHNKLDQQMNVPPKPPSVAGSSHGARLRVRGSDSEHTTGRNIDLAVADADALQNIDFAELARSMGLRWGCQRVATGRTALDREVRYGALWEAPAGIFGLRCTGVSGAWMMHLRGHARYVDG